MRYSCAVLICMLCWGCASTRQFSSSEPPRKEVFAVWENLNRQEALRNYSTICEVVDTVLQLSSRLPRRECQWYHAISYFTRARAEGRLDRPLQARRDILLALDSGYRNDALMKADNVLMESVGKPWFDTVIMMWTGLQHDKMKRWQPQEPIILRPEAHHSKEPIIIAFHGGNGCYDEFASHFLSLPQTIGAVFGFPAGLIKYSPVCHSWPIESIQCDSMILSLIDSMKRFPETDPTQVYLIGYSQGATTAIGFSLRHPDIVSGTILFSGFTSEQFSDSLFHNASLHQTKFYALSGTNDAPEFLSTLHDLSDRCIKADVPFYFEQRNGMIHGVPLNLEDEVITGLHWFRNSQSDGE